MTAKRHTIRKTIVAAALLLSVMGVTAGATQYSASAATAATAESIADMDSSKTQLQSGKDTAAKVLESLKQDESKQEEYKAALDQQLKQTHQEVTALGDTLLALDQEIQSQREIIETTNASMVETLEQLGVALPEQSEEDASEAAKATEDTKDSKSDDSEEESTVQEVAQSFLDQVEEDQLEDHYDSELLSLLKYDLKTIAKQQSLLEENQKTVLETCKKLEAKEAVAAELATEREAVVAKISETNAAYEKQEALKSEKEAAQLDASLQQAYTTADNAVTEEERAALEEAEAQEKAEAEAAAEAKKAAEQAKKRKAAAKRKAEAEAKAKAEAEAKAKVKAEAEAAAKKAAEEADNSKLTWPVPSVDANAVSSGVGTRSLGEHYGIDIVASKGSKVVAAVGGTVVIAESSCTHNYAKSGSCGCGGGYGNYVIIDHGNGLYTTYGHMTSVSVQTGDTVKKGQKIGTIGSTGYSTGYHLHFELRKGYYGSVLNPLDYVK